MGYLYGEGGGGGGKVGKRSLICQNGWDVWDACRVHNSHYYVLFYIMLVSINYFLSVSYTT